ncbi:MAG: hypothetical protein IPH85_04400 [Ignavibacteria bacterium]|nr:hypothetical protein [Ignavibacteria bacterium]
MAEEIADSAPTVSAAIHTTMADVSDTLATWGFPSTISSRIDEDRALSVAISPVDKSEPDSALTTAHWISDVECANRRDVADVNVVRSTSTSFQVTINVLSVSAHTSGETMLIPFSAMR